MVLPKFLYRTLTPLIIACLVACLIIMLGILGRISHALQFFSVSNSANLPTLRPGRFFFTTNLIKPRKYKYCCYRAVSAEEGLIIRTHRLCGLPGDTVEVRVGILYVNGQNADAKLPLTHLYKIDQKDIFGIVFDRKLAYTIPPYSDTIYAPLEQRYVQRSQLPCVRYILPPGVRDEAIYRQYKKNWNRDHFGPLRVPPGKLFVLGDNRENAEDSRYVGFIAQTKYMGTILWK